MYSGNNRRFYQHKLLKSHGGVMDNESDYRNRRAEFKFQADPLHSLTC